MKLFNIILIYKLTHFIYIILISFCLAILEMSGILSLLPFLSVLTSKEIIYTNEYLNIIFEYSKYFGVFNYKDFVFFSWFSFFYSQCNFSIF